jgi:hypothetical protein
MAIAVVFTPAAMSVAKYDECMKRLEQAGESAPAGRRYHACHTNGNEIRVFDVWDSRESFERFGQTLMPILREIGVDPGLPTITDIHNIVEG